MATTQFTFTQSAGTSAKKFTVSMWWKPGTIDTNQGLWGCGTGTSDAVSIHYQSGGNLSLETYDGSANPKLRTTRLLRDPAAWYHLVFSIDTTDSSASERLKIWINGVEETVFIDDTTITQDSDIPGWSAASDVMKIGNRILDGDAYFDGEMAHVHVIDGTIYAASAFGETDSTSGIWVPKTSPSVTYGTNGGFYKFASGALTTDSSGNSNTLTQVGTPTTTKDTPDNNFATMNPLNNPNVDCSYTKGNNSVWNTGQWRGLTCSLGMETGKWYTEFKITGTNVQNGVFFGVGCDEAVYTKNLETGNTGYMSYRATGFERQAWGSNKVTNNSSTSGYGTTMAENDIGMIAFDATNGTVWTGVNGTWDNSATSAEIAAGTTTNAMFKRSDSPGVIAGTYFFGCAIEGTSVTGLVNWNFGNGYFGTTAISSAGSVSTGDDSQFEYDVPTGFYGLNTKNLGSYS